MKHKICKISDINGKIVKWLNLVCGVNCSLHPTWGFKVMLQSLYQPDDDFYDDDNDDDDQCLS